MKKEKKNKMIVKAVVPKKRIKYNIKGVKQ